MKWPFGRKPSSPWEIVQGAEWICANCDMPHHGMFDLACHTPDPWTGPDEYEPNSALDLGRDFLSEDFCVIGGKYFMVRSVLELPIRGTDSSFGFGCWGTLKRENFEIVVENFDEGTFEGVGPWGSWLCNRLLPFMEGETEPLGCHMFPQTNRQRPVLVVADDAHPLAVAQEEGITPEDVLAIYEIYGHSPAR